MTPVLDKIVTVKLDSSQEREEVSKRRFVIVGAVFLILGLLVTPAQAQQRWVSDFDSFSVTPTVQQGPPLSVDIAVVAHTSGYWWTSTTERVWLGATVWTSVSPWVTYDSTQVGRSATQTFSNTFSFVLPQDGVYNYAGWATYWYSSTTLYSTYFIGAFNTLSRAGIPAATPWGLALLGLLLAGAGVTLLRRT